MIMFFLQTLILVAAAFALGCLFGYWLKRGVTPPHRRSGAAAAITHSGAAHATTAGELAASRPHYEPASRTARPAPAPRQPIAAAAIAPVAPQAGAVAPAVVLPAGVAASAAVAPVVPTERASAPGGTRKAPRTAAAKPASKPASAKPATAKTGKAKSDGAPSARTKPAKAAVPADEAAPARKAAGTAPKTQKPKAGPAAVADNLKQIKGVGPQIEAKLNAAGINSFAQIASWSKADQTRFAEQLSFAGRIEREDWVGQARILAEGGTTDFAKRVARGEVESSAEAKPKGKR